MNLKTCNPWPITIAAFFVLLFLGLVAFIVFATTHHVDLVQADYYEKEVHFQQQMDRVQRTGQIGQPVVVAYDRTGQCITVRLPSAHVGQGLGQIHLYRPSDASLDQTVPLRMDAQGIQRLDASGLRAGLWQVRVEWTVAGQEYYFDQRLVLHSSSHS